MTTDNTQNPIESLPLTSLDVADLQRQKLKELFPEALTEGGKVDWDKLRLTLGEMIDTGKERFGMNWPGKADCFKTIQQPSVATLVPARDESVDFDTTENLFIEGDNLEVLKLLQKSYLGKVKMIYIDPPYNTGNDFIYPDNYSENLDTYLEYTGQIDGEGRKFSTNVDTDGRFHSKWMNMMYPRLFLAKNLLREDGVIFISIDDSEAGNLRSLCSEIFGEENFVTNVIWQKRYTRSNNTVEFTTVVENIFVYAKSEKFEVNLLPRTDEADDRYTNPDNDPKGPWKGASFLNPAPPSKRPNLCYPIKNPYTGEVTLPTTNAWRRSKEEFERLQREGQLYWGMDKKSKLPSIKMYLSDARGLTPINFWSHDYAGNTDEGTKQLEELFDAKLFDFPKPVTLIKRVLEHGTDSDSIVLDFFAGSATTAHAVMDLNQEDGGQRKFICVQLPEPTDEDGEVFQAGYKTISEISKERIRRASSKIKAEAEASTDLLTEEKAESDLGFRVFKLTKSNFHVWDASVAKDPEAIQQALELHVDHISPEAKQEAILFELLLKSGFELTTPIEAITLAGKTVYSIADGALLICLEKQLTNDLIKAMAEREPMRVVCLDEGFQNNDQLKTNAVLIMKSKGVVDFRTV